MTGILRKNYTCPKCGTEREIGEVMSINPNMPRPNVGGISEKNKCSKCGESYKWGEAFKQKEEPANS